MASFSKASRANMEGLHPFLITLLHYAIGEMDFSVRSGVRTEAEQAALYAQGRTTPGRVVTNADGTDKRSAHQIDERTGYGHAVDLYPYPWNGEESKKQLWRFVALAHYLKGLWQVICSEADLRAELVWGGDWDSDFDFEDQSFDDLPHFELRFLDHDE